MLFDSEARVQSNSEITNWGMHGAEQAVKLLQEDIKNNKFSRSYLITGPKAVGKRTLATRFAQEIFSPNGKQNDAYSIYDAIEKEEFGDVQWVRIGGECKGGCGIHPTRSIGVCQIRSMNKDMNLKSFTGTHKVFVIDSIDDVPPSGQDALLKQLEEPPPHTTILLLSANPGNLNLTIRSRCQLVQIPAMSRDLLADAILKSNLTDDIQSANKYATITKGCYGRAYTQLTDPAYEITLNSILEDIKNLARAGSRDRMNYSERLGKAWRNEPEVVLETLNIWKAWWREALQIAANIVSIELSIFHHKSDSQLTSQIALQALTALEEAENNLQVNVNARLALDVMMIDIPQLSNTH
jgi:DNA polymerase-3 subunit delta'|tara:strand:+ start:5165 stop:6226 length:1062 start_codon:yes stop_codon:yes gene_type:complete